MVVAVTGIWNAYSAMMHHNLIALRIWKDLTLDPPKWNSSATKPRVLGRYLKHFDILVFIKEDTVRDLATMTLWGRPASSSVCHLPSPTGSGVPALCPTPAQSSALAVHNMQHKHELWDIMAPISLAPWLLHADELVDLADVLLCLFPQYDPTCLNQTMCSSSSTTSLCCQEALLL